MQYYAWEPCAGYGNLETQGEVADYLRRLVTDLFLWAMVLSLMELDPSKLNRSLHTFKKGHATTLHGNQFNGNRSDRQSDSSSL